MVTNINQLDPNGYYTYADYLLWKFQERVELLRGKIYPMAAPNVLHQQISGRLFLRIGSFLEGSPCQVFAAPFDVRLPLPSGQIKGSKIDTVVQPDLSLICDASKLDEQGCSGPPDLVIEILSKGNSRKEVQYKFELYEHAGIPEYWIIHPEEQTLLIYRVDSSGKYQSQRLLTKGDIATITSLTGFSLDLDQVF